MPRKKKNIILEEDINMSNENLSTIEKETFTLEDGTQGSRSAYIRQEFKKDRSRNDIAKELGVKYYIVYAATANMFNAAHPEGGSGASGKGSVLVAKVNADLKFVDAEGNEVEEADAVQVPRAELMRELAKAGVSRSQLKDYFDVPYATVYAATKDVIESAGRSSKTIVHPETGENVSRAEYIRELYATGMDRRAIAKLLTDMTGELVDYSTVWAATKPKKEAEVATPEVPEEVEADEE